MRHCLAPAILAFRKNGEPTRLLLSLNAWGASSKADAKAKAAAISKRNGLVRKHMKD